MAAHTVKNKKDKDGLLLYCSCGWTGYVTHERFIHSAASRHILQAAKWPFIEKDKKTPTGWETVEFTTK